MTGAPAVHSTADSPKPRTPREAWFASHETIPLREAVNLLAAEPVIPYPPGVAVVVPGEPLTPVLIDLLQALAHTNGVRLTGCADPELKTIRTVRSFPNSRRSSCYGGWSR